MNRSEVLPRSLPLTDGSRSPSATAGVLVSFLAALLFTGSSASAATFDIVGGELLGAFDVVVDGDLYDVTFVEDSCDNLFFECGGSVASFAFTTEAAASLASAALFDQVFLDGAGGLFDTQPELTNGCTSTENCGALTPYEFVSPGSVLFFVADNGAFESFDFLVSGSGSSAFPATPGGFNSTVYAVWTPVVLVPEPGTALLMSLGLVGLASRRRS